ncbi:PBP1A family penicillin-binding protein [Salinarimonas soli]|uniref:PBP1A family penicillin-binding protein n=2 Tax=Salinarimonas soli TaxID=1638099 RepID=A0A5B2VCZ8_9HYPH|nr:PBP1A family penicillin-binding protein [Salinarimonas soli]
MSGAWERYSNAADKLSARGLPRVVLDLTSEAVTLGALGGIVMLGLAVPAFRETHDDWRRTNEFAITFLDRYGQEVGHRGIRHDDSLELDQIPDNLIKAALATEDRRFYEHWGIDPIGTARALVNNSSGGSVQGGSTLSQQLAKNVFLTNERSLERKVKEAFLALWLEWHLSKNEILKLYLDRAYMGGGNFGVAAASDYYFGKSVKDLNLAESAMLAGLFKAPTKFAPHINLPAARARAAVVLYNMVDAGFLTEGQIQIALRNPATPVDRGQKTVPDNYLDWAFDRVKRLAQAGKLGYDRVLVVKTPLDVGIQKRAEEAIESILRQHGKTYNAEQSALVVTDPDGAVRAIVGGRDYGQSQFNRATDALRQPGSSFKPFVYATALAQLRYRPNSIVRDAPVCIGNWCPANYNRSFAGAMPLTTALAKSINTIPVRMSLEIGRGNAKAGRAIIIETARRMGVETPLKDTTSLPIGASEVTVMDMAAGYSAFANGGRRAEPYAAVEIRNSHGEVIYRRDRDVVPEQVLSTQVVEDMNYMLSKVPEEGTGKRAALDGIRSAGKTGTTNAYRDAWYVGYTGNYVMAVWFGNDDYESTRNMTGGTLPAMAFKEIMDFAHQGIELKPLPGVEPMKAGQQVASAGKAAPAARAEGAGPQISAATMSRRSFEVIGGLTDMFRSVEVPKPAAAAPANGRRTTALVPPGEGFRPVGGRLAMP